MALSQGNLQTLLLQWMTDGVAGVYPDLNASMVVFGQKYHQYASAALDPSNDSPTNLNAAIISAFLNANLNINASHTVAATKYALAIIAYWTGASFGTSGLLGGWISETSSTVTSTMTINSIKSGLETLFIAGSTNVNQAAQQWASILHAATLTVSVTINGFTTGPTAATVTGNIS